MQPGVDGGGFGRRRSRRPGCYDGAGLMGLCAARSADETAGHVQELSNDGAPSHHPGYPAASGPSGPVIAPKPPPTSPADRDVHLLDSPRAIDYRYRRVSVSRVRADRTGADVSGLPNVTRYRRRRVCSSKRSGRRQCPASRRGRCTGRIRPYLQHAVPHPPWPRTGAPGRAKLQPQDDAEFNGTEPPSSASVLGRQQARQALVRARRVRRLRRSEPPKADETNTRRRWSAPSWPGAGRAGAGSQTGGRVLPVAIPAFAANAANALVDEYVAQNLEVKLQSTQHMLEWLDKELAAQQTEGRGERARARRVRDRQNAMSLDDKKNIVLSRLNALNDPLSGTHGARSRRKRSTARSSRCDRRRPRRYPSCPRTRRFRRSSCSLTDLQRQKAQLCERYGEQHPEIVKVNASLADTQRQLELETNKTLQSVKNEYDRAVLEERTLSAEPRGRQGRRPGSQPQERQPTT